MFQLTQPPLINITTHDQAIMLLTNLWMDSNTAEKLLWQAQLNTDKLEAEIIQQQQVEEVTLREAKTQKEQDSLHKDKQKKNQGKFLPIHYHPVPQRAPAITS